MSRPISVANSLIPGAFDDELTSAARSSHAPTGPSPFALRAVVKLARLRSCAGNGDGCGACGRRGTARAAAKTGDDVPTVPRGGAQTREAAPAACDSMARRAAGAETACVHRRHVAADGHKCWEERLGELHGDAGDAANFCRASADAEYVPECCAEAGGGWRRGYRVSVIDMLDPTTTAPQIVHFPRMPRPPKRSFGWFRTIDFAVHRETHFSS